MTITSRNTVALALSVAATLGCTQTDIAGVVRPFGPDAATPPSGVLLGYTHPIVTTDIPHAPLKTMGGSYAATQWVDSPENIQLLKEMVAARVTPETIHTMTNHLYRKIPMSVGCGADRTTAVSHDTWCDYVLDNPRDERYTIGASTLHEYRHSLNGKLSRTSVSREREYRPSTTDTIVKPDSVQAPSGPTGGTGPRGTGGSGGSTWTICWDYYELDLTTGDITLLFTTCPVSPGGQTQSASPADGFLRADDDGAGTGLIGVSALLVEVPALPRQAKIMVQRTRNAEFQYLILGAADASDSDWAGGIEVVKSIVRRDGPDAPPASFGLGKSSGMVRPEAARRAAALRQRLHGAQRRAVPGHGLRRAIPLTMFVER